jgi:ADP-ribosyl-[dinitrogen reductase] hydrolase
LVIDRHKTYPPTIAIPLPSSKVETFKQAILLAANLGDDADTTSAICGQLAGAYYGVEAIPPHWLHRLHMREFITELADRLHAAAPG